jgi:hypothetical protein
MAKAITAIDVFIDKQITDAIKTTLATYQQTKLAGDVGTRTAWADIEKRFVARMIARNRRGNTGFRGDISLAGQTP